MGHACKGVGGRILLRGGEGVVEGVVGGPPSTSACHKQRLGPEAQLVLALPKKHISIS